MEKQNQTHNKDWFNKIRLNSWEVEILIVGFVLVMMLQIPNSLDALYERVELSSSMSAAFEALAYFGKIMLILVMELCVYILITSFSIYLFLRGFWVGLIGFSSVYPDGINIKQLNFNKIFSKKINKLHFNDYIIKIDNLCSLIFSFSFCSSFIIISMVIFGIQLLYIITFKIFLMENYRSIVLPFNIFFHWPHLLLGIIYFIDFSFFNYLKKIKWKPFGLIYNFIDKFFKYTTLIVIYEPLYYAIISNIKKRIILGSIIGFVIIFSLDDFFDTSKHIKYFPSKENSSKNLMSDSFYENKFTDMQDHHVLPMHPFINADIITDNYMKLYIPYFPEANVFYESICNNIEDIYTENVELDNENNVLNCMNNAYKITIDGMLITSDFIFYNYSKSDVEIKTFFMPIQIKNIKDGKHIIKIEEMFKRDFQLNLSDDVVAIQVSNVGQESFTIPFYIFKD